MPWTFSIVELRRNSGAISKMPPMATTTRMPINSTSEFFSKISWFMGSSLRRHRSGFASQFRGSGRCRLLRDVDGGFAADRAPDVDAHQHGAEEEEHATG